MEEKGSRRKAGSLYFGGIKIIMSMKLIIVLGFII